MFAKVLKCFFFTFFFFPMFVYLKKLYVGFWEKYYISFLVTFSLILIIRWGERTTTSMDGSKNVCFLCLRQRTHNREVTALAPGERLVDWTMVFYCLTHYLIPITPLHCLHLLLFLQRKLIGYAQRYMGES